MPLAPGLSARLELTVTEADTALALGSGDVPVLGTPRLVALAEEACCRAIAAQLGDDETTVGMRVQLDHLAPTAVGMAVTAEATLEKVEGRRLTFTCSANDPHGLIAAGKLTRVVVERDRFLKKSL
ncbi:MAG TPA: hotdog domain-containing protein [Acidimicrobiales bacterium]|nr:hotdog domain-containing protein [Acidimicrobiales bacterium]